MFVVLGLFALADPAKASPQAVEITSSIILLGEQDLQESDKMCIKMIDNARKFPQSSLNFILTGYWMDENRDNEPEYYCYNLQCLPHLKDWARNQCREEPWPAGVAKCDAASPDLIKRFHDQLLTCFKHAVHRGFDIR
jgi:hypothetical protein